MVKLLDPQVKAWQQGPCLLEHYQFAPGPVVPLPSHAHEAIQFCFNQHSGGVYAYRRARHAFPAGSLTVINSGEAHAPGHQGYFQQPASFRLLYLRPASLHALATQMRGGPVEEPYFPQMILITDTPLPALLLALHGVPETDSPSLDADVTLLYFQQLLLQYHAGQRITPRPLPRHYPALRRVREYLHAFSRRNVSLQELAEVSCLSRYHLVHLFKQQFGLAPHQYLTQIRIDRAKTLLLAGGLVESVARRVGFFDASHLMRHFRRVVGLPILGLAVACKRSNLFFPTRLILVRLPSLVFIRDLHHSLGLCLTKSLSLAVDYDWVWRDSKADGLYAPDGNLRRDGTTSRKRFVGRQLQAEASWQPNRHLKAAMIYVHC